MKLKRLIKIYDLSRRKGEDLELQYYNIPHPSFNLYRVFFDKQYIFFVRADGRC